MAIDHEAAVLPWVQRRPVGIVPSESGKACGNTDKRRLANPDLSAHANLPRDAARKPIVLWCHYVISGYMQGRLLAISLTEAVRVLYGVIGIESPVPESCVRNPLGSP